VKAIEKVVKTEKKQVVLYKRNVETFNAVTDERDAVVDIFLVEAIAAEKEEQRHVEHIDEVVKPLRTARMANDHEHDAQALGYVDDVAAPLVHNE